MYTRLSLGFLNYLKDPITAPLDTFSCNDAAALVITFQPSIIFYLVRHTLQVRRYGSISANCPINVHPHSTPESLPKISHCLNLIIIAQTNKQTSIAMYQRLIVVLENLWAKLIASLIESREIRFTEFSMYATMQYLFQWVIR